MDSSVTAVPVLQEIKKYRKNYNFTKKIFYTQQKKVKRSCWN